MQLTEDFLYQLKQNNSIVSVMSSYVNLIRRGHNYVCLCPFHSEKTASCTVYPDNDSFFCFGCGAGGDAITFIRKIENLEYIEAIKFLAERAGIAMPEDARDNELSKVKARTLEINRATARFYFNRLTSKGGEKGLMYFKKRELAPATIKKYGLGYAADDWHELHHHLMANGFTEQELITAGVCRQNNNGNVYDTFRDRVIFPIIDLRGNVVGFGGRILDAEGPKYINSSDTPVFKKSRNLFSLNFAKSDKSGRLILAEGYMDVIAINQAGFENVVATLGTALTQEQARLMSQYAKEVIIAYDSDGAGQTATHKAVRLLDDVGVNTRVLKMEGAKDPDEFIKKFGAVRFKLLMDNSDSATAFEIEKCKANLDLETDSGKIEFLKRVVKVLAEVYQPIEREIYILKIANEFSIAKEVIKIQVDGIIRKRTKIVKEKQWEEIRSGANYSDKVNPEASLFKKEAKAETGILYFIFSHPEQFENIRKRLSPENFVTSFNKKIYSVISEKAKTSQDFTISSLGSEFTADEMGKISEILARFREILVTEQEIDDYIDVLLTHKDKAVQKTELTNDELLSLQAKLKNKKI